MTDLIIRQDVIDEFDFDPALNAKGIGVAVDNGVVTLTGHVPNYMMKVEAERAAKRVRGVRAVALEIEVRLMGDTKRNDDEIAARAVSILSWSAGISDGVKVVVENGWVKLTGSVEYNYQKQEAERAIRRLSGVIGVSNLIGVRAHVSGHDVRERIAKALKRSAELESAGIHVSVADTTVTLTGKVKAWRDRQIAEDAAWAVPGVTKVTDDLVLQ